MKVIQLIGGMAGEEIDVEYHVAQRCVQSLGGNGTMALPGEDVVIRGFKSREERNAEVRAAKAARDESDAPAADEDKAPEPAAKPAPVVEKETRSETKPEGKRDKPSRGKSR